MQVISDQLPYLQGYMPILQLCLAVKYKIPGLYIDTGAGVVTADDYAGLEGLVEQGIR